eukprot:jgi/Mesvir1/5587/Mv15606-RA.1
MASMVTRSMKRKADAILASAPQPIRRINPTRITEGPAFERFQAKWAEFQDKLSSIHERLGIPPPPLSVADSIVVSPSSAVEYFVSTMLPVDSTVATPAPVDAVEDEEDEKEPDLVESDDEGEEEDSRRKAEVFALHRLSFVENPDALAKLEKARNHVITKVDRHKPGCRCFFGSVRGISFHYTPDAVCQTPHVPVLPLPSDKPNTFAPEGTRCSDCTGVCKDTCFRLREDRSVVKCTPCMLARISKDLDKCPNKTLELQKVVDKHVKPFFFVRCVTLSCEEAVPTKQEMVEEKDCSYCGKETSVGAFRMVKLDSEHSDREKLGPLSNEFFLYKLYCGPCKRLLVNEHIKVCMENSWKAYCGESAPFSTQILAREANDRFVVDVAAKSAAYHAQVMREKNKDALPTTPAKVCGGCLDPLDPNLMSIYQVEREGTDGSSRKLQVCFQCAMFFDEPKLLTFEGYSKNNWFKRFVEKTGTAGEEYPTALFRYQDTPTVYGPNYKRGILSSDSV